MYKIGSSNPSTCRHFVVHTVSCTHTHISTRMQAAYPPSSPPSPIRSRKIASIPGFRAPPKPKPPPIEELTTRELRDLYDRNAKILATPSVNSFRFYPCHVHPASDAYTIDFFFLFFFSVSAGRPRRRRMSRASWPSKPTSKQGCTSSKG
jgi:hypothetical protein